MSTINNGGPAFPTAMAEGMSLRDYFAALAMQGMLADGESCPAHKLAQCAYVVADAMLQAREANK